MKVAAFTLSVLLICVISYSLAQITFSRGWVRGKYPDEEGGDENGEFHREVKSKSSDVYLRNPDRRSSVKVKVENLTPVILKYLLEEEEKSRLSGNPIPYSQLSKNFDRVK